MNKSIILLLYICGFFLFGALLPTAYPPFQWLPLVKDQGNRAGIKRTSELDWNLMQIEKKQANYKFVGVGDSRLRVSLHTPTLANMFSVNLDKILLLTHGGYGRDFQFQRLKYFYQYNKTKYLIIPIHSPEFSRTHGLYDRFATVPNYLNDPEFMKIFRYPSGKNVWEVIFLKQIFRKEVKKEWGRIINAAMRPYYYLIDFSRSGYIQVPTVDKEWHEKLNPGRGYYNIDGPYSGGGTIQVKMNKLYSSILRQGHLNTSNFNIEKDGNRGPMYIRKMLHLGIKNRSKIIFFFIPSMGSPKFSSQAIGRFRKIGFYCEPDNLYQLQHPKNWADLVHVTKETGIRLTQDFIKDLRLQNVR